MTVVQENIEDHDHPEAFVQVTVTEEGVIIDAYEEAGVEPTTWAKTFPELYDWLRPEHPDPWKSDPDYPVEDWRHEVANDDTRHGYLDWVQSRKDANR